MATRTPLWIPVAELPDSLRNISVPPKGLWCLGEERILRAPAARFVAIVGTRDASPFGERMAQRLAAGAARAGLIVVSGMARGIDAAAHRGAMAAGGKTVAILGTGVDVPYPASHRALHGAVQDNGLVLSEFEPGRRAFPGCFPRRNRLIAALARLVVVVEAGHKSGAMNTVNHAYDLNRAVGAVPGQADDPLAEGVTQVLRDGGHVIADVEDLLAVAGLSTTEPLLPDLGPGRIGVGQGTLSVEDAAILAILGRRSRSTADIVAKTQMSVRQVATSLLRLELAGYIEGQGGSFIRLVGKDPPVEDSPG